mgnify:CR=1 FL=1|jgi:predicted SAM-dependent methyltransferase
MEQAKSKQINKKEYLKEFFLLAKQLNTPRGIRAKLNSVSNSSSLRLTIILQKLGINKSVVKKHNKEPFFLNIGFGDNYQPDCVNTDLVPTFGGMARRFFGKSYQKPDCYLNVLYLDKHLENVADGVVFSHVLEHMPPCTSLKVLSTINSYLKSGGGLRISVPSISSYENLPIPTDQKLYDYSLAIPLIAKNSLIYRWGHKFMYDAQLLIALLEEAGFVNVFEVASEEGFLGNTDVLRRSLETIYITAFKA